MNDEQRQEIIRRLQQGEELSPEWARILFPPEKREYELVYHGKEREEDIIANTLAVPLQKVRTFGKNDERWHNKLIFGDNLQVMKSLLELKRSGALCNSDGTDGIRLVYIDPPFSTKRDFRGSQEEKAYQDKIAGAQFIEFLRKRLVLLRELLSPDGSIYVHFDTRRSHYVKTIMDEIFGENRFTNEIIWKRGFAHSDTKQGAKHYGQLHETIFLYRREGSPFVMQYTPYEKEFVDRYYSSIEPKTGRRYWLDNIQGPGGASKGNPFYEVMGIRRRAGPFRGTLDRGDARPGRRRRHSRVRETTPPHRARAARLRPRALGFSELFQQPAQIAFDFRELGAGLFAAREAAQRHEDQQRLVRSAAVAALPYANVVEGVEDLVGRHHQYFTFLGKIRRTPPRGSASTPA
jgi:hypothetical protein